MRWRITYTDGTEELTDENVDRMVADGEILRAYSTHRYGPDDLVASYVLANVRKWEAVR